MRLTKNQLAALEQVAADRVEYGTAYPAMARRSAARGNRYFDVVFLVDGHEPDGSAKQTLPSLEERGLIVVRHDLVPKVRVPEQTKTYSTLTGTKTRQIPEHDEPADPGWRTKVELTEAGRTALG